MAQLTLGHAAPVLFAAISIGIRISPTSWLPLQDADFSRFLASADALQAGVNPYALDTTSWQNLNPPVWFPLFTALASIPPEAALIVWRCISLVLALGALALCFRRYRPRTPLVAALMLGASVPLWSALSQGQVYLLLLAVAVVAWFAIEDRHDIRAGLALGLLVALKPNMAVWPALLFLMGRRRVGAVAGSAAGALWAMTVPIYGFELTRQWLTLAGDTSGLEWRPQNASLLGAAVRMGVPNLGTFLSILMLVVVAVWALRRPSPSALHVSSVGIGAALLAAPVAWLGYMVLFIPGLVRSAAQGWRPVEWVILVFLAIPAGVVPARVPFADAYCCTLVLLIACAAWPPTREA